MRARDGNDKDVYQRILPKDMTRLAIQEKLVTTVSTEMMQEQSSLSEGCRGVF
jgi:hypothetical protein